MARTSVLAVSQNLDAVAIHLPRADKIKEGTPGDAQHRLGNGGSDVLKLDDALAVVDDFVAQKLGL